MSMTIQDFSQSKKTKCVAHLTLALFYQNRSATCERSSEALLRLKRCAGKTRNDNTGSVSCDKTGCNRTHQTAATWRSERRVSSLPEKLRRGRDHLTLLAFLPHEFLSKSD